SSGPREGCTVQAGSPLQSACSSICSRTRVGRRRRRTPGAAPRTSAALAAVWKHPASISPSRRGTFVTRPSPRGFVRSMAVLVVLGAVGLGSASAQSQKARAAGLPSVVPAVSDYQLVTGDVAPPSESDCFAIGRRCFTPTSMQNSYNLPPLYAAGNEGQGVT